MGLVLIFVLGIVGVLLAVSPIQLRRDNALGSMWLRTQDGDRLRDMLRHNDTLTESQMREIQTWQFRNVIAVTDGSPALTTRGTVAFLAIVVLGGGAAVLLLTCYPGAVFFWGDGVERHERLKQRRNFIWVVVVTATVVGIASNVLSTQLVGWFDQRK